MLWWQFALLIIAFSIVMLLVYNVLKRFVLSKIRVNRWIILAIAALVLVIPALPFEITNNTVFRGITSGIFVILFLWYMDTRGYLNAGDKGKGKDNIVIKPKAKPNRVKKD
jgi:hypothetical protein